MALSREFFARPTLTVAKDLLGTTLVRNLDDGRILTAPIVEVEAYTADDPACHAYRGITERCRVMFGPPGFAYVYFIYGMYFCLNAVTEENGTPGAVLIRALGMEGGNGPGKLCREWNIDKQLNGVDFLDPNSPLQIKPGIIFGDEAIGISERIGIKVAVEKPWRFFVTASPHVSGRKVKRPGIGK